MNWFDEDKDEEDKGEEENGEFHIPEPEEWEEPEIGVDLPPEPPEPPEIEHSLNPEEAKKKSQKRVQEMMTSQDTDPQNNPRDPVPPHSNPQPRNTAPIEDTSPTQPVEEQINQDSDQDSLDEFDRRINIAETTEDTDDTEPVEPGPNINEATASDQELVDQILEIHTDIARASEHTDGLDHTLEKLRTILQQQGIEPIEPSPGDKLDYYRHTVIETVDSPYPEETIVELVRPGYQNSKHVIEEALVRTSSSD